jgi:hypothetical protein
MKSTPTLVRTLRVLFGVSRIFCLIGLVIVPFTAFIPAFPLNFVSTTVRFNSPAADMISQDFHPASGTISLDSLEGHISVTEKAGTDALQQLKRQIAPTLFITYLLWFAVTNLLWRVCRNIETGQVFVADNLKLLRWLGVWIIVCGVLMTIAINWEHAHVAVFVKQHATFGGLTVANSPNEHATGAARILGYAWAINYTELITGLLLLALAEVFRQGLALKRESELTV